MPEEKASFVPARIRQQGSRELAIRWSDGAESVYDVRALRLACGCAQCVDEVSGQKILREDRVPQDVRPLRIHDVGNYAISVVWSDGHDTGIYSFEYLRRLCPCCAATGAFRRRTVASATPGRVVDGLDRMADEPFVDHLA